MITAEAAGTLRIGGDIEVARLGFGAMRITGDGVWGPPADRTEAAKVLAALPRLGVTFIDTADSYGPFVSEELIAEVLHPYDGLLIATKGGLVRHGPSVWRPVGRPEYLRQCVLMSLRRLKIERIDLWQLHRIDPKIPRDEQFGEIAQLRAEGLIRHVGLSEAGVEDIEAARSHFLVATVQNRYNLADRASEAVLTYCERHAIAFIPWYPLGAGSLLGHGSVLSKIANDSRASPAQIAIAWALKRSSLMLPIPGTSKLHHLEENVAAAQLMMSDADFETLSRAGAQR